MASCVCGGVRWGIVTLPANTSSTPAITAESQGYSDPSSDVTALLMESFDYSTLKTQESLATSNGIPNTDSGLRQIQREQSGYALGLRRGSNIVMQSPMLENLCMELAFLRKLVSSLMEAGAQQEKTVIYLQGKVRELAHHILTRPRDV